MIEWAEREVEIACKRENPNREEGEFDYGCACYESALKALKSLMEDGHSGFSIGLTKNILNRLIDGKPLTPIEDTDNIWNYVWNDDVRNCEVYQCKRMSSLFKHVYTDGSVRYSDNDCYIGIDIDNPHGGHHMGLFRDIIEELYPITMPYMPLNKPYEVYAKYLLTDPKNGDFDTVGIFYAVKPDGERVEINRYFKEGTEEEPWIEINQEQWIRREFIHNERIMEELGKQDESNR